MRIYGSMWEKRLRKEIQLNQRRKGFVPVDGCYENVNILKSIIANQHKKWGAYQIVFLDLAKSFDTVTHDSVRKALQRKGVAQEVIDGIVDMYRGATTAIGV